MRVFTLTKIRCHFSTAWKRFRASPASEMRSLARELRHGAALATALALLQRPDTSCH